MELYPENYVVFDLETTGFSPRENDIIQIGLVDVVDGDMVEGMNSWLMNPNYPNSFLVPRKITELTGITSMDVSVHGLDPGMLVPMIGDVLNHSPIVTHNGIAFDRQFWNEACRKYDTMMPWNGYWLDTAVIYKAMKLDALSLIGVYDTLVEFAQTIKRPVRGLKYNLPHCCRELGVDISDLELHRADADCVATQRLFEELRVYMMGW